ncbi:MAG TPA: nucleotide pyrophosphohydrolase [Thermoplasmatales archaeon]|nr:nucleotide pyrophosphohydrolase [Thermoplasmatales archaeon]HEX17174.1 nucleotide pyrophosphohydrolase [Thermoplasmatales archaeon]
MEIRDFQKLMDEIYGERDRKRGIERTCMWVIEELGELVRAIRKSSDEEIKEEIADVVAWIFSLANLLNVDIETALKKYLDACPKCGKKPCECKEGWTDLVP